MSEKQDGSEQKGIIKQRKGGSGMPKWLWLGLVVIVVAVVLFNAFGS